MKLIKSLLIAALFLIGVTYSQITIQTYPSTNGGYVVYGTHLDIDSLEVDSTLTGWDATPFQQAGEMVNLVDSVAFVLPVYSYVRVDGTIGSDSVLIQLKGKFPGQNTWQLIEQINSNKTTWHQDTLTLSGYKYPIWGLRFTGVLCTNALVEVYIWTQSPNTPNKQGTGGAYRDEPFVKETTHKALVPFSEPFIIR